MDYEYIYIYILYNYITIHYSSFKTNQLFQPLRLDIKRKLTARSDRVKCVGLHPTEPWMLASLYNGNVHIWNHETQQLVKSFEVLDFTTRILFFSFL